MKLLKKILAVQLFLACMPSLSADESKASDQQRICQVCRKPATVSCVSCELVGYCSKAHQIKDWSEGHEERCWHSHQLRQVILAHIYIDKLSQEKEDFFTTQHLQNINGIMAKEFDIGGLKYEVNAGAFRRGVSVTPFQCMQMAKECTSDCPTRLWPLIYVIPPFGMAYQNQAEGLRLAKWVAKHGTHAWTSVGGVLERVLPLIKALNLQGIAREQEWTRNNLFIHPPHRVQNLIFNENSPSEDAAWEDGEKVAQELERRLKTLLEEIKDALRQFYGDRKKIIETAASAYMSIVRLQPFAKANKRTALILTNAILAQEMIPPCLNLSDDELISAICADLKTLNGSDNFYNLLSSKVDSWVPR